MVAFRQGIASLIVASFCILPVHVLAENSSISGTPASIENEVSVLFLEPEKVQPARGQIDETINLFNRRLQSPSRSIELDKSMVFALDYDQESGAVSSTNFEEKRLNPGKALLLSALIPGTGELYIASNSENGTWNYIKSALFFTAEMGFWYGAISYAMRGQDQEDKYEAYADKRWNEDVYQAWEFYKAKSEDGSEGVYEHDFETWQAEDWEEKRKYLPNYFTHELPDSRTQQYYEMIGKYLLQFGAGWLGEYDYDRWQAGVSEGEFSSFFDGYGWNICLLYTSDAADE